MRYRASQPDASDLAAGVIPWRRQRLQCAGFDPCLAERLATDSRFDLHAVLELIDRGCPPALAARILAPLDDRSERPH